MKKLSKDNILSIPEMSKTMRISEIALTFHVSTRAINYWIAKLRQAGHRVATRRGPLPIKLK